MNDSALRTLAGVGGSGTTWGMNSLYGKSARTVSLASMSYIDGIADPGETAFAYYQFYGDGYINYFTISGNGTMGQWTSPITAGIGASYWVRFTQTASAGPSTETGNARNTWVSLNSAPYFGLEKTTNGQSSRTYTVQIASDSGGSNIVATRTDLMIAVEIIF
jgi:hypothetical protein